MRPLFIGFIIIVLSCAPAGKDPGIIDMSIGFNETRKDLTLDNMSASYGIEKNHPEIAPRLIVIHWTAIPTLESSFKAFDQVKLSGTRGDIQGAGDLKVSAHFLMHYV